MYTEKKRHRHRLSHMYSCMDECRLHVMQKYEVDHSTGEQEKGCRECCGILPTIILYPHTSTQPPPQHVNPPQQYSGRFQDNDI